jgi:hypothetical protein
MKRNRESKEEVQNKNKYEKKMRKNEELQNEIHFAISRKPILNMYGTGAYSRVGKYLKIFSYLILFIGFTLVLNSCMGGYVASEPSYVDYARPQRPSDTHIWINGNWNWNSQHRVYVQTAGYWDRPRQGHSYVEGRWQTNQRGKTWSKGYWQKDNRQRVNRQRDYRENDNRNR